MASPTVQKVGAEPHGLLGLHIVYSYEDNTILPCSNYGFPASPE